LKKYETVFILDPGLDEITWDKEVKKLEELIENNKGKIIQTQRWGLRKLSYRIKKKNEGYYVLIQFEAPVSIIRELDRYYKLNESCLRFLNVVLEEKKVVLEKDKETSPLGGSKEKV
jgi:small subunit ribosomal protein S6